MTSEHINRFALLAVVTALHVALLAAAWHTRPPQLQIGADSLSYVDLTDLPPGPPAGGEAAPAPELPAPAATKPPPAERTKPVAKPQPKPEIKPVVKPVVKPDQRGDIRTDPKPEPKPEPRQEVKPEPKPDPRPEPKPKPEPKADAVPNNRPPADAERPANSGSGSGRSSQSPGGGQQQGSGQGSSGNSGSGGTGGSGPVTPPTHLGSHLGNPKPPYPQLSLENGEEGSVGLRVVVTPEGRAASVSVVKGSGFKRLDNAARNAVAKYRFTPAKRGGVPIQYTYTFSINFNLRDAR